MPCPLFEPQHRVDHATDTRGRLPLIYEFDGICHAGETGVEPAHRLHYCNRGHARGYCSAFPKDWEVSALQLTITSRTPDTLNVLVMEEANHWPRAWSKVEFVIAGQRLQPDIQDVCRRAQVFHFCRSYLEKFVANQ